MSKRKEMPEMTPKEINIIDNLRARNLILREAVKKAASDTGGIVGAYLQTALDRERALSE